MDRALSPGAAFGRYQIVTELSRGAMGTVYLARDPALGRRVALKVISTALATTEEEEMELRARFEREGRIAARLRHPGIVQVHDVGRDPNEGRLFIALEYVEGETLRERLTREGRVPVATAVAIGVQLADALQFAHAAGIVHRDVKPSNVMIAGSGVVKITDFGIARVPASDLTRTGVHVGTPNFMAPEQVKGRTADARSDIFSVGVILYWMVTGKRPFGDDDPTKVAYRTVNVLPEPPAEADPQLPRPLSDLILKALEKDPARRFQTGEDLGQALRSLQIAPEAPVPEPGAQTQASAEDPAPAPIATVSPSVAPAVTPGSTRDLGVGWILLLAVGALAVLALAWLRYQKPRPPLRAVTGRTVPSHAGDPDVDTRPLWDLAVSYYRAGRLEEAIGELERILELDPDHRPARKHLELAASELARSSPELPSIPDRAAGEGDEEEAPTGEPGGSPDEADERPTPGSGASPADAVHPSRLGIAISHRLDSGSLQVLVDGNPLVSLPLEGEKKLFGGPKGENQIEIEIPAGRHRIAFRVTGARDGERLDVEGASPARTFAADTLHRLELRLDKTGALEIDSPGD